MLNILMVEGDEFTVPPQWMKKFIRLISIKQYCYSLTGIPRKNLLIKFLSVFQHKSPFRSIDLPILTTISSLQSLSKVTSLLYRFLFDLKSYYMRIKW